MGTTTLLFIYLGNKAGESIDNACMETLTCFQSTSPHEAEKLATLCGAYVGFVGSCVMLAADICIEKIKNKNPS